MNPEYNRLQPGLTSGLPGTISAWLSQLFSNSLPTATGKITIITTETGKKTARTEDSFYRISLYKSAINKINVFLKNKQIDFFINLGL